jgi:pyruvate dehydrogenase E2 component (dihydrolipoamide acetyltransferase)
VADVKDATVPDIGDFTDVPVVEVHVEAGATVAVDDPLITLETDKASMDVPAPFAGTVEEMLLKVGDTASQGTVVARIAASENGAAATATAAPRRPRDRAEPRAARPGGREAGATPEAAGPVDRHRRVGEASNPDSADTAAGQGGEPRDRRRRPSTRALVRRWPASSASTSRRRGDRPQGPDPARGRRGAPKDARRAAREAAARRKEGEERSPLTPHPAALGANLAAAWPQIPLVTHNDEADITDLEAFRKQLNAEQDDVKVTMVALLLKACAATLDAFPRFASRSTATSS